VLFKFLFISDKIITIAILDHDIMTCSMNLTAVSLRDTNCHGCDVSDTKKEANGSTHYFVTDV